MKTGMFKYSLLAGAMVFSGLTMAAAPSTTLLVKGQVSTGTCTAVLSTPNVNLGTTSTDKIPATGGYAVKDNYLTNLNINCTSPLKYQISMTDNRSDSPVLASEIGLDGSTYDGILMGLGTTTDGIKIGAYRMGLSQTRSAMNGNTTISTTRIRKPRDVTSSWTTMPDAGAGANNVFMLSPANAVINSGTNVVYFALAESGKTEPCATTSASFELRSWYYLSSKLQSLTDQQQVDGSVTFNLDYL